MERTLHKLKPEGAEGMNPDGTPILFECEGGDLSSSAAFDDYPPADVIRELGPCEVCPICFPLQAEIQRRERAKRAAQRS